jgi:hypothetical protein
MRAALRLEKSTASGPLSPQLGEQCEIYEVVGLPADHQAFIRRTDGTWKLLRVKNGVRQSWDEGYPLLEDAFAAIRSEYEDLIEDGTRKAHGPGR